jgi:hypothetical protein
MQKRTNFEWEGREPSTAPEYNGRGRPPRGGSSFLARFGQVIVRHGIAAIPSAIFHFQGQLQLTAQEVWFISAVLAHKWTEDLPHPNLSRMSVQTGVQERRLRRYKHSLSNIGYLLVYPRYEENGRQDSNYYDFGPLFERLENLIAGEQAGQPQINSISAAANDEPDNDETLGLDAAATATSGPDTSFVARFGSVIVSRGVAAIPQALFTCQGDLALTPQQVWFVSYILSVPWSPPYPYPSLLKMATRTGYSKMQLHEIKNSLVDQGYLRLVRRIKQDGGQDSNGYDFAGLFDSIRERLQPHIAPHPPLPSQEPIGQPTETGRRRQGRAAAQKRAHDSSLEAATQLTGETDNTLTYQTVNRLTGVKDTRLTGQAVRKLTGEEGNELTHQVNGPSTSGRPTGLPGRRMQSKPYVEPSIKEQEEDDSNHPSPLKKVKTRSQVESHSRYSPYIAQVITDFSQELGDADHIVSNVSQTLRLWGTSGLSEEDFVASLYDAKNLTRKYQSRPHHAAMQNKMAYFFTVMRSLVRT